MRPQCLCTDKLAVFVRKAGQAWGLNEELESAEAGEVLFPVQQHMAASARRGHGTVLLQVSSAAVDPASCSLLLSHLLFVASISTLCSAVLQTASEKRSWKLWSKLTAGGTVRDGQPVACQQRHPNPEAAGLAWAEAAYCRSLTLRSC